MSYMVFARKWRPQTFDEVIGEEHIITTLKNAILGRRVAHAYLFAGPRGIGKTSIARIFAKALNCEQGAAPEPCNKCASCSGISSGSSMDVMEIDGASNNNVEQIRELRENIKFSPSRGRYKIYIIDEVHMLSIGAFNALLKTLEEPPAHAKFIFATTNPEKVPPTILSRCQRFDFVRIPFKLIMEKLRRIVKAEGLKVSEEALFAIARASDGSLRDAESILDQLASFSAGEIGGQDVIDLLGMIEEDKLAEVMDKLCERDAAALIKLIDEMVSKGKDISQFIAGLMSYIRNMMVIAVSPDLSPLIDFPENYVNIVKMQSKKFTIGELLYIFYALSSALNAVKKSEVARFILEAVFIKLSMRNELMPLADIVDRISAIESNMSKVSLQPSAAAEPAEKKVRNPGHNTREISPQPPESFDRQDMNVVDVKEACSSGKEPLTTEKVKGLWPVILQEIKGKKISVASYLMESGIVFVEESSIMLGFAKKFSFYKEAMEHSNNKKFVEEIISQAFGRPVQLKFMITAQGAERQPEAFGEGNGPAAGSEADSGLVNSAADDSLIQSALEIFNGKIVRIKEGSTENEQA